VILGAGDIVIGERAGGAIPSSASHFHAADQSEGMTFNPNEGLPQDEVTEKVEDTIENNEVVLFMKGTEMMPQCGYSDKALTLINHHRDDFETVDVLESLDEFRAALEAHSGRETIPQTFVDGEFVGGSDILEQYHEREELGATLNA